jgi:hypothetical protein
MPKIARWDSLPPNVGQHLIDRMRDRAISLADLKQLRVRIESQPKCRKGIGRRTSVLSKSAVSVRIPRLSCCVANLQRASLFDPKVPESFAGPKLPTHPQFPGYSCPFPFAKYRIGVVPSCFRNIEMNALGLL